jgi:hypothetical protein
MEYFVEEKCLKTECVAYLTAGNCYGYSLRSVGKPALVTLFPTKEIAQKLLDEHLAIYPNTPNRETKIRCYGTNREMRELYVDGMIQRYGNVSK